MEGKIFQRTLNLVLKQKLNSQRFYFNSHQTRNPIELERVKFITKMQMLLTQQLVF